MPVKNALCCQAVCFLSLHNVSTFRYRGGTLPRFITKRVHEDSLTFVLGRWFEPHPNARERDKQFRPICPGMLHINHCLWRFAIARKHRRALSRQNGTTTTLAVNRQAVFFGRNMEEQRLRLSKEKFAYFCLVDPDSITGTALIFRIAPPTVTRLAHLLAPKSLGLSSSMHLKPESGIHHQSRQSDHANVSAVRRAI